MVEGEEFHAQLRAFPPCDDSGNPRFLDLPEYDKLIKLHVANIHRIVAANPIKEEDVSRALAILDPMVQSASYLMILFSQISEASEQDRGIEEGERFDSAVWRSMKLFFQNFDPIQIRYCGHEFRSLVEYAAAQALEHNKPHAAIDSIRMAILRLDPSSHIFTQMHTTFVNLCLMANDYAAAFPILDLPIYRFSPQPKRGSETALVDETQYLCGQHESALAYINTTTGLCDKLRPQQVMQYFLFGAMCYMACKKWKQSYLFLELAIQAPTVNSISKMQIEAYKKLILVSLISTGKKPSLPHSTSAFVAKTLPVLCYQYESVAVTFEDCLHGDRKDSSRLLDEIEASRPIFTDDCNNGLVSQIVPAYHFYAIKSLQRIYARISVGEILQLMPDESFNAAQMSELLTSYVEAGQIQAQVSQCPGDPAKSSIFFVDLESTDQSVNLQHAREEQIRIMAQSKRIQTISKHLHDVDREFLVGKEYVQQYMRKSGGKGATSGHSDREMRPFDLLDEDMMAED